MALFGGNFASKIAGQLSKRNPMLGNKIGGVLGAAQGKGMIGAPPGPGTGGNVRDALLARSGVGGGGVVARALAGRPGGEPTFTTGQEVFAPGGEFGSQLQLPGGGDRMFAGGTPGFYGPGGPGSGGPDLRGVSIQRPEPQQSGQPGMMFPGGSPTFNERTGERVGGPGGRMFSGPGFYDQPNPGPFQSGLFGGNRPFAKGGLGRFFGLGG